MLATALVAFFYFATSPAIAAAQELTPSSEPGWTSLLPALVAIVLAIAMRQVLVALTIGVWLGALLISGGDVWASFVALLNTHIVGAVADKGHASILVFSLLLGGMIGVVTRSGGGAGLAKGVTRWATSSRRGALMTWFMGLVVFFDDYANALIVGSSMRPIADRLRISREKLAFVVDATAAPVSSIALISSWIAVELAYIGDEFKALGIEMDAYTAFVKSLPYRFYPWLMLFFVFWLSVAKRDFGPMAKAEKLARAGSPTLRSEAPVLSDESKTMGNGGWVQAVFPIAIVMVVAAGVMYFDGSGKVVAAGKEVTLQAVFGEASSTLALLVAAGAGSLVAVLTTWLGKALSFDATMDAWLDGVKDMMIACLVLVLAWSLGGICEELGTAQYLTTLVGAWVSPALVPAVIFVLSAAMSFATGTSWGTMAILFPLVIPLAHNLAPGDSLVLLGSVSAILSGSVWGDHCSPISDTTILSSMAAGCDHIAHVQTQLPYALTVGMVSLLVGEIGVGLGWYPVWGGLLIGAASLVLILRTFGQKIDDYVPIE